MKQSLFACAASALLAASGVNGLTATGGGGTMTYDIVGDEMVVSSVTTQGWYGVSFQVNLYHSAGSLGFHCDATQAVLSTSVAGKVSHTPGAALEPAVIGGQANCQQGFRVPLGQIGGQTTWKAASGPGAAFAQKHNQSGNVAVQLQAGEATPPPTNPGETPPPTLPGQATPPPTTPPPANAVGAPGSNAANGGGFEFSPEVIAGIGAGGVVVLAAGFALYSRSKKQSPPPLPPPPPALPDLPQEGGMQSHMNQPLPTPPMSGSFNNGAPMGMNSPGSGYPLSTPYQSNQAPMMGNDASSIVEVLKATTPWRTATDQKSGRTYYFNKETGETSWKPPSGTHFV